jgi:hypothetical protein
MAALHAKENKWDDCILLNSESREFVMPVSQIFLC